MKKYLFVAFIQIMVGIVYAQQITVVNKNHITISGISLIQRYDEITYTADFFYPDENRAIEWVVAGGTILSQNTNASLGPITVTIRWTLPNVPLPQIPGLPIDPNAAGVVAITQARTPESIYQGSYLFVYRIGDGSSSYPFIGCQLNPQIQYINHGQTPCVISGVPECVTPFSGVPHTYQWEFYDNATSSWIFRTNTVNYQPPVNEYDVKYRRITQDNAGNSNTTPPSHTTVTVKLYDLHSGTLYPTSTLIRYGEQPYIVDEMPYGGPCKSENYSILWEVSYNYGPWQIFGTSLHLPDLPGGINKRSVRIRRLVSCDINKAESNIVEFTYNEQAPKEKQNYVKTNTILVKGISDTYEASLLPIGSRIQNSIYYDGLGRPIQNVKPGVGTALPTHPSKWFDIVKPIAYDGAGRSIRNYLPYPSFGPDNNYYKIDAFTKQLEFYESDYSENTPFGSITYENNPLGIVKKTSAAGETYFANGGQAQSRIVFDESQEVKRWKIGTGFLSIPEVDGNYKKGDLYKLATVDEHGGWVYEYKDKSGKLVFTVVQTQDAVDEENFEGWVGTYYIYDDFERLRCIVTPKAFKYLRENSWVLRQDIFNELCFYYDYDSKGRVVYKQTPQAGGINLVYDSRDRVVMTQDAKQKLNKQWFFILYDELDREKITGILTNDKRREEVQSEVENLVPQIVSTIHVSLGGAMGNEDVEVFGDVSILGTDAQFHTLKYYDNYTYQNVIEFNTNHGINATNNPNEEPIIQTGRTIDIVTGLKARILDNSGRVLTSTFYYDDETRMIQTSGDNIKDGRDTKTSQYDFGGRVLNSSSIHTSSGTGYTDFPIYTHNSYDKLGRPIMVSKQFGTNPSKDIASYSYDFFGRIKLKKLGLNPATGGTEMESLEYTYNLNGQLQGINEFYAKKDPTRYEKWRNFFGLYLGYDNRDAAFSKGRFDGKITGAIWSTQGDDVQRKYDYLYDKAGRLVKANFGQKDNEESSTPWTKDKFDFSVKGASGNIEYDENGNLLRLLQMGVIPGRAPVAVDNLSYSYSNNGYSNKLISVTETNGLLGLNGVVGDFNNNSSNQVQYEYDLNGNLIQDENKKLQDLGGNRYGIEYNYLDKVEKVRTVGKGVTEFIYDALGNKLQKIFTPDGGSPKTTSYIDEYTFEDDKLLFINFEEGRLRIIESVSTIERYLNGNFTMPGISGNTQGVFDYFIKDNLGNTRVVITEEQQWEKGNCTMDHANETIENVEWGQITALGTPAGGNELIGTRTNVPPSWTINTSTDCVELYNADGKRVGPNRILKVMAGDKITARANYFYLNNINSGNQPPLVNSIITSLVGTIAGGAVSGMVKDGNTNNEVQNLLTNSGAIFTYVTNSNNQTPGATTPKAYIHIIFLDEQFNYVGSANPDRVDVAGEGNMWHKVEIPSFSVPKNGYAYVFLSNESNEHVYFDNMYVEHERGRLVEENHYYPFGLRIAGISSRKAGFTENGTIKNLFLYQSDFAEHDEETGWDGFDLRNYDPQIGRWTQVDQLDEFPSPYTGMGNDPINNIDPTGGGVFDGLGAMIGMGVGLTAGIIWQMHSNDESVGRGFLRVVGSALAGATIGAGFDGAFNFLDAGKATVSNLPVSLSTSTPSAVNAPIDNSTLVTNPYAQYTGQNDGVWLDLTKDGLSELVKMFSGKTFDNDGAWEDYIGDVFEWTFHSFAKKNFTDERYTPNVEPDHADDGTRTIIDAKSDAFSGVLKRRYPQAAWWEIKAKRGGLWLSSNKYQITRELAAMRTTLKTAIADAQASFNLVTTSDTQVGWSVGVTAIALRINYSHWVSQYKVSGGGIMVRFILKAPPYGAIPGGKSVPLKFLP